MMLKLVLLTMDIKSKINNKEINYYKKFLNMKN